MPLHHGPCTAWPVDTGCCPTLPDDVDPALVDRWALVASQLLWRLSGRRWGPSCPVTVRPCRRDCVTGLTTATLSAFAPAGRWVPYIDETGAWRNALLCGCDTTCHCGPRLCTVRLEGPVYDLVEVRVDGAVLDPVAYRVDSANQLTRVDGACWPSCSDLLAGCDQPGAWCVTYRLGLRLDEAAIAAVSELTCHLIAACLPPGSGCECRLPGRVQRVARQGVTVDLVAEATAVWREGRTGLPLVDAWLATVNPHNLTQPSRVYSPDHRRPTQTTWPG